MSDLGERREEIYIDVPRPEEAPVKEPVPEPEPVAPELEPA